MSHCVSLQNAMAGMAQHKVISQLKGATLLFSRVIDAGSERSWRARVRRM